MSKKEPLLGKERTSIKVAAASPLDDAPKVDLVADAQKFPDGLTTAEANIRIERFGFNELVERVDPEWKKFVGKFWGPMPIMIWLAVIVEAVQQDWTDFFVLFFLQALNGSVAYFEEKNAGDAIAALKGKMAPTCTCKRNAEWNAEFLTRELVPGDLVRLKLGDIIPADVELIGVGQQRLEIDQAALTGESLPVNMSNGMIAKMGSIVKKGEMDARVAFSGSDTFFGKTAALIAGVVQVGRFQKVLFKITMFLLCLSLTLVTIILVVLIEADIAALKAIGIAVVLLVASIPIAMQVVSTSTMAVGSRRLAQKSVIVAKLSAIEELAGMDMLCSDKTGTLTQNKLTLYEPKFLREVSGAAAAEASRKLYLFSALSCKNENFEQQDEEVTKASCPFDKLEDEARQKLEVGHGGVKQTLDAIDFCIYKRCMSQDRANYTTYNELKHNPFDPSNKRTESKVETPDGKKLWVVKGSPQVILEMCMRNPDTQAAERDLLAGKVDADIQELADRGYRALSVAHAEGAPVESEDEENALKWVFDGTMALADPPRLDTADTIEKAYQHGVEVKMITGDHTAIAKETCSQLSMGSNILPNHEFAAAEANRTSADLVRNADGFAEVFPETKFRIVEILQEQGFTCGMTGDGVNDAPALKKAQIGIAVSGSTDAARAAADIVLVDDGLSVIIDAILRARKIFQRVRNYGIYRVACTIQLVFFFFFAVVFIKPSGYYCAKGGADADATGLAAGDGGKIFCSHSPMLTSDFHDYTSVEFGMMTGANGTLSPMVGPKALWPNANYPAVKKADAWHKCFKPCTAGMGCNKNSMLHYVPDHWRNCPEVYPVANFRFTLPVLAIVIITILNDVSIITISHDKVIPNKEPQQWRLPELYCTSAVCGFIPCLSSMLLLLAGLSSADGQGSKFAEYIGSPTPHGQGHYLEYDQLLMVMYLKISISDFLTVFSARCKGWFNERRPGYALGSAAIFATTVSTIIATCATIPDETYNMQPISGAAAGYIWLYNILWFFVQDLGKIIAYKVYAQLNHADVDKENERLRSMRAKRAKFLGQEEKSQRADLRASGAVGGFGGASLRGSFLNVSAAAGARAGGSASARSQAGMEAVLEAAHQRILALENSQSEMARQLTELKRA